MLDFDEEFLDNLVDFDMFDFIIRLFFVCRFESELCDFTDFGCSAVEPLLFPEDLFDSSFDISLNILIVCEQICSYKFRSILIIKHALTPLLHYYCFTKIRKHFQYDNELLSYMLIMFV